MLLSKGYPDIGWNPCGGEKYLDFLRFAVFVNGQQPATDTEHTSCFTMKCGFGVVSRLSNYPDYIPIMAVVSTMAVVSHDDEENTHPKIKIKNNYNIELS